MDEAGLIARLQAKDEKAFKELVETYQGMVYRTCFGFLHSTEDAEDMAQEVFIQVYNSIEKFRGASKLSTWLYRIAVNKSLNKLRGSKVRFLTNIDTIFEKPQNKVEENPFGTLENKEKADMINRAIDQLPVNQRTAFILSKYEDVPNKQIAKIMELSLSSIEALHHRAKKNLQKLLVGYYRNQ
ncbi:MAG: RNA polymerase sigma factor [Bacteroidota bacterium]